jgi:hypothetical protein
MHLNREHWLYNTEFRVARMSACELNTNWDEIQRYITFSFQPNFLVCTER